MAVSSIVIIVCAAVGGAVVLAVAGKLILAAHRRRTNPSAPLPPARPLTMLQETPWALSRQQHFNASTHSLQAASQGRLPTMSQRNDSQFMYSQFRESGTEEALLRQPPSPMSSPVSGYYTEQLTPPQPMFIQNDGSSGSADRNSAHLSWNSATDESEMGGYPPQRHQSSSSFPHPVLTDPSVMEDSGSANGSNPSSPMLTGNGGSSAKRLSTGSSIRTNNNTPSGSKSTGASSVRSTTTRSLATVRGAPHRPHSRVDIVLPTPLAPYTPASRPQTQYNEGGLSSTSSRASVCDPWLNVGRAGIAPLQSSVVAKPDNQRTRRSSETQLPSRPKSRHSASSASSRTASTDATLSSFSNSSRSSSYTTSSMHIPPQQQSPPATRSRKISTDTSQLPPVPRVPSMYSHSNPTSRPGSAAPSPVSLSAPKQLPSGNSDVVNDVMTPVRGEALGIAV